MRLLLLVCLTALMIFCACGKKEPAAAGPDQATAEPDTKKACKGPKVLCLVFLTGDAAKDNPLLKQVSAARGGEAKLCVLTVNQEQLGDAAIKALADFIRVDTFPVVTLDGLPVTGDTTVKSALKEHLGSRMAGAEAKLESELNDKGEAELMFFGCADKDAPLEKGRFFVLAARSEKLTEPALRVQRLAAVIADRPDYSAAAGSCHVPETLDWKIPEGLAAGDLELIAAVCDSEGRILGMTCSCLGKKSCGGCGQGKENCE